MVEMGESEMAGVSGQGPITFTLNAISAFNTAIIDPFTPGAPYIPTTIGTSTASAVNGAIGNLIDFHLLPITGPSSAVSGFNGEVIDNSSDLGAGVADFAFMTPFRLLDLASQGKSTALDYLLFPISAPLDIASNVFSTVQDTVVGKTTAFIFAPFNLAMGPVNRVVGGVKGRIGATVDGAGYAFTEVGGALITGAFASASQGAADHGLGFTSRVFGRIAQAQAGLTNERLTALAKPYGLTP